MNNNMVTGAFFGDEMLPKADFIKAVNERLASSSLREQMLSQLNAILSYENNLREFARAYEQWEIFQSQFLFNTVPISLMVIANFTGDQAMSKSASMTYVSNQKQALGTGRYLTHANLIEQAGQQGLKNVAIGSLASHFNTLMNSVQTTELTPQDRHRVFFCNYQEAKEGQYNSFISRLSNPKQPSTYRWVIWGRTGAAQFRGQLTDAFLNHLAAMHQSLFSSGSIDSDAITKIQFTRTVMAEEQTNNNFFQLLVDSTNNTNWLSGGDINLVDEHNRVIAKIQLKTIQNNSKKRVGALSTKQFFRLINSLKTVLVGESYNNVGELLYNNLKTSAIAKHAVANTNALIKEIMRPVDKFKNL